MVLLQNIEYEERNELQVSCFKVSRDFRYFEVLNDFRISIVNLCKEESLYNEGLRPLLYSMEDAKKRAVGWRRCGENIAYYRNDSSYVIQRSRFSQSLSRLFLRN